MGRKSAWWSPVLLAIYDPDTLIYTAVCKCMSGFTDEQYLRIFHTFTPAKGNAWEPTSDPSVTGTIRLPPLPISQYQDPDRTDGIEDVRNGTSTENEACSSIPPDHEFSYDLGSSPVPDIFFYPREVWETRSADITLSPVYMAAQEATGTERGLSLRFPRFMRVRHDRTPVQASTAEDLTRLWMNQK